MMASRLALLALLFAQTPTPEGEKAQKEHNSTARPPVDPVAQQYEVLRPDAAWCGPRVLYFFACYYGGDQKLSEVVSICRTDKEGFTSLLDLVAAAEKLGLEPTPIRCDADQILSLGGPAILCVGRPNKNAPGEKQRYHFIGLIGPLNDRSVVIDPSLRTETLLVPRGKIASSFTGHAILLKGCPRPVILPSWLFSPWVLAGSIGFVAVASIFLFRRRLRSGSAQLTATTGGRQ